MNSKLHLPTGHIALLRQFWRMIASKSGITMPFDILLFRQPFLGKVWSIMFMFDFFCVFLNMIPLAFLRANHHHNNDYN